MPAGGPIVVKLGGSFIGSPYLDGWLDVLAGCGGHVVVVPGGGPFADAVRIAQAKLGFDDRAAHHMALIAMEQAGRALAGIRSSFATANTKTSIHGLLQARAVPIWSPTEMVLQADEIPASWDVTSDSLAAWLAREIGAARLLLVKHGEWSQEAVSAGDLVRGGIVDKAFPRFLTAARIPSSIVGAAKHAIAAAALRAGTLAGTRIDLRGPDARRLLSPCQRSRHRAGDGP